MKGCLRFRWECRFRGRKVLAVDALIGAIRKMPMPGHPRRLIGAIRLWAVRGGRCV